MIIVKSFATSNIQFAGKFSNEIFCDMPTTELLMRNLYGIWRDRSRMIGVHVPTNLWKVPLSHGRHLVDKSWDGFEQVGRGAEGHTAARPAGTSRAATQ